MNYVFTVRSVRKGKFTNEPGAMHFLAIPDGAKKPDTDHAVRKSDWFKTVLHEAEHDGPEHQHDEGNPCGDIVVYIHGFNHTPEEMLERHKAIRKGLEAEGFEGVVVSFDWPSANTAVNYLEDRNDAKTSARRLVEEGIVNFAALQRPECKINVHLFAHSMGCYVVREAFDDADDRPAVAARNWSVSQVILVGVDVSAGSMKEGGSKSSSLYRHCVRLTNYYNPFDGVLSLSNVKRVGVSPRLGRIGLPEERPEKAVNVNCGHYYKSQEKAFKKARIKNPGHIWYFFDQRLMTDVYHTIMGEIDREYIPNRFRDTKGLAMEYDRTS